MVPTEAELKQGAMKEFTDAFAQKAWKCWAKHGMKQMMQHEVPQMTGQRRARFLEAMGELVEMR